MRVPLSAAQTDDALDEILSLVVRVRTLHAELRMLALEEQADGYPRDTGWDKGSPSTEYDDDGTPLPPRTDPTANAVMARAQKGYAKECLHGVVQAIHIARRNLEHAECEAMRARPKDEEPIEVIQSRIVWCRNRQAHTKPKCADPEIGGRRGLCGYCEAFEREHKQLPPRALVEKNERGDRIYDRDVRQALKGT